MTEQMPARFGEKLRRVIADALANLAPDDLADRVARCQATGEHGTRAHIEGDLVRLTWGGRDLALVERDVLVDDLADLPPAEWIAAAPDHVPEDWGTDDVP